ncbi:MAG: pilus assembly PilX N-terminal domain-containing protein [Clostridiaceae bacterium]
MKKKGSAVLVVIIIMMVAFLMAAYMIKISLKTNKISENNVNTTKAYYSAETGVYDFIDYIKNENLNVSQGTNIKNLYNNGGLYEDAMSYYSATLQDNITVTESGTLRTCTFSIYSEGTYGTQNYIIIVNASIIYDNTTGSYEYSSYKINRKIVYKA